jgi:hypothetical protein
VQNELKKLVMEMDEYNLLFHLHFLVPGKLRYLAADVLIRKFSDSVISSGRFCLCLRDYGVCYTAISMDKTL